MCAALANETESPDNLGLATGICPGLECSLADLDLALR